MQELDILKEKIDEYGNLQYKLGLGAGIAIGFILGLAAAYLIQGRH